MKICHAFARSSVLILTAAGIIADPCLCWCRTRRPGKIGSGIHQLLLQAIIKVSLACTLLKGLEINYYVSFVDKWLNIQQKFQLKYRLKSLVFQA